MILFNVILKYFMMEKHPSVDKLGFFGDTEKKFFFHKI